MAIADIKLQTTEYVKILDALCEGEIEGIVNGNAGVYLDDVPILGGDSSQVNIQNINTTFRVGTAAQTYISGFDSASTPVSINSAQINKGYTADDGSIIPASPKIQRIDGPADSAVVTIELPQGLKNVNLNDGKSEPYRVDFRIEYRSASNSTYRILPDIRLDPFGDISYNTTPAVVLGVLKDNYTGVVRDYNYGAKLAIKWTRPASGEILTGIGGGSSDYDTYSTIYAGDWVKIKVEYKKYGASDSTFSTLPGHNSLHITAVTGSTSFTTNTTPGRLTRDIYFPVYLYLPDEDRYSYRVTFLETDIDVHSYAGERTTINYKSVDQYIGVADRSRIEGKALSAFKKDYYFKLPQNDWPIDIRISRITDDDDYSSDENSTRVTGFTWSLLLELIEQKFTYPNTALVALEFDAASYATLPKRSYDVKLLKVNIPSNYDPISRRYIGLWTGGFKVAWSDNPAWAFYDLVTKDRYGMGQYIKSENINKWTLYEISKWCDEMVPDYYGGTEPRYTINTYITKQEEALVLIRNLASIFRGMVMWMDNKITATFDHPSDTVCAFSNANVVDGSFTYTGSSAETRYNTVNVAWNDPMQDFEVAIEAVEDTEDIATRGEIIATKLTALGCTSRGQARRHGKAFIRTERETVLFQCSLDNVGAAPGNLVEIYDRYRANIKYSGRIKYIDDSYSGGKVYLDGEAMTLLDIGETYKLSIISNIPQTIELPNGTIQNTGRADILSFEFPYNNYRTSSNTISVSSRSQHGKLLLEHYNAGDIPDNTVWAIKELYLQPQIFRIISIAEKELDLFEINALAFNQSKQAWIDADEPMIYPLNRTERNRLYKIDAVLIAEEVKNYGSTIANTISFHWGIEPNNMVKEFIVEYRYDALDPTLGDWIYLATVNDASYIELDPNTDAGYYTARVAAVLYSGNTLEFVESSSTDMQGKDYPPKDILACPTTSPCATGGFTYEILDIGMLRLEWEKSIELDFSHYEIQNGPSGFNWDDTFGIKKYNNIIATHYDIFNAFQSDFLIKAVDLYGNKSINAAKTVVDIKPPTADNIKGTFTNFGYKIEWDTQVGIFPIHHTLIEEDDGSGGKAFVVKSRNDEFETSDLKNWSDAIVPNGDHKYYLTPYDNINIAGPTIEYITHVDKTSLSNVVVTAYTVHINIYWDFESTSFPVRYVELKVNDVFRRNIYGNVYSYTEFAEGDYKYEMTPVDIAGRRGIPTIKNITLEAGTTETILYENLRLDAPIPLGLNKVGNTLVGPVDPSQTWLQHFNSRGYTNIQDQIDAGYPNYTIPGATSATYTEVYTPTTPPNAISVITVQITGIGLGNLTIEVRQKVGGTWSSAINPQIDGSYITSSSFTDIQVSYIFTQANNDTYTLDGALIIGVKQ